MPFTLSGPHGVDVAKLNGAYSVAVQGNYAFVTAYWEDSLTVVDVSNPAAPVIVGTIRAASLAGAIDVAVLGNYAYVAAYSANALTVVDITDPAAPVVRGTVSAASLTNAASAALLGNYAYIAAYGANALTVVDITDPAAPVVRGTVSAASLTRASGVAVLGSYAYVAAQGADALTVVDITDPAAPVVVGTVTAASLTGASAAALLGNYAYIAAYGADALTVVDITDPTAPVAAGTVTDASLTGAFSVAVLGTYAYIAALGADSLTVVDVANPAAPAVAGTVADASLTSPTGVFVVGTYAYVAAQGPGALTVVDITDPAAPAVAGTVADNDSSMWAANNYPFWGHGGPGANNYPGPFHRGSDAYVCWTKNFTEASSDIRVWRSQDGGIAWVSQDEASMPTIPGYMVAVERLNQDTLRLCYANTWVFGTPGVPAIRDFDLVTNTLGPILYDLEAFVAPLPPYGTVNPTMTAYHRSSVNPEDRIFTRISPEVGEDNTLGIELYRHDDSLGFFAPLLITDNVVNPLDKQLNIQALYMDPAGTSHIMYSECRAHNHIGDPEKPTTVYYRQVDAAGNMTAPVVVYVYQFEASWMFGFPNRVGSKIIFPFPLENGTSELDKFYTGAALVVEPYNSPAPTVTQVSIPTQQTSEIQASTLGADLYLWWFENLGLDGITSLSRIMYATFDGTVTGTPQVFYDAIANPSPFPPPGATMGNLSPPVMDAIDPMLLVGMDGASYYWFTVPGPIGTPPVALSDGSHRLVILIPNRFDLCLDSELMRHLQNRPQQACCEPILYRDINWVRAPKDYIPFRKTGAVPTPLPGAGDVEVLNFQVPFGYDGLIAGLFNVYTGPGFREGNGDIEWRLLTNRVYAVHLGRIMVTLGGQDSPYPVDGGIFVQSGTRVRYVVNVPNLSGGILPLQTQIVCGLEGLFYARS
jgi:hypothetical protein